MKAIIISCFNWYAARLKPIRQILIEMGYDVDVFIADYDHIRKHPIEKKYEECTYVQVPAYQSNYSFKRLWSHWSFEQKVYEQIQKNAPDLIYCQVPPNNIAKKCAAYKQQHPKVKLYFDIIDLWPESMPINPIKNTLPAKTWKNWRDSAIPYADHVFTECDMYQQRLQDVIDPLKTSTLFLYKEHTEEAAALIEDIIGAKREDGVIRFAYLGSMNNIIDIDGICKVINQTAGKGIQCELHAIGDGTSRKKFEEEASKCNCKSFFYGIIFDEKQKIRILAACDYALNIMKENISVGLTSKSIDYFSYGLPIINNIHGDTWELVLQHRIGLNIDHCDDITHTHIDHRSVYEFYQEHFSGQRFIDEVYRVLGERK